MSVRVVRLEAVAGEEARAASEVRALAESPPAVEADVRAIVADVRERGDAALRELTARFDGADVPPERLRVAPEEIESALRSLDVELGKALETAIANVRAVARSGVREGREIELPAGQRIETLELPVRRAAAYVPGGRAPYPSTVVMCAVTAREAGVDELAVCAPPGRSGAAQRVILGACALCGVDEVYRMGGAQAIAALAYGTESVPPVDVIAGPGSAYVQEAKRQVFGRVGLDGIAGPSELVVVASEGADPQLAAFDLLAQSEHGAGSLVAFVSDSTGLLAEFEAALSALGPASVAGTSPGAGGLALVRAADAEAAIRLGDLIAPEHMQLMGSAVEGLAGEVRAAGALFVGPDAATAFGDYVAGSNHVLPTGGAARYASALSVATFRRRMSRVRMPPAAASALAPAGAAIARAEGFSAHAASMERRADRQ